MATCGPENIIQKAVTGQWTFYCQQTSPHASCVLELVLEQLSLRIDGSRISVTCTVLRTEEERGRCASN